MKPKWLMPEDTVDGVTYSQVLLQQRRIRLRITGYGKVLGRDSPQPWHNYRHHITDVWIDEGITEIGKQAFYGDPLLQRVWLPGSLRSIGKDAFANCPMLEEICYCGTPEQLQKINIPAGALPEWFVL